MFIKNKISFINSSEFNLRNKRKMLDKKYRRKINLIKYLPIFFFSLIFGDFLSFILFSLIWWLFSTMFFDHKEVISFKPSINVWFGVPGSGKTSMAAYLTKYSNKLGYRVLSNVEIKGAYRLESEDLGRYDMSFDGQGCHVVYDEGSIDFDNRNFKSFANSTKPLYFSIHRHMNNRVDVFSQGYDIDKRIRDRAGSSGLFYLKKMPIAGLLCYRSISKVLFIKKDDKQMVDGFKFKGLPRFVWCRSVWDSFDTLDMSICPKDKKNWAMW